VTARVVVLLNSLLVGGAEVFAIDCAAALDRTRFDVSIATLRGDDTWLAGVIDRAGLARVRLRHRDLARYLARERVDVLQTHHTYAGVLARIVGKAALVPAIVCTEQLVVNELPTRYRLLNDATIGLADAHVCITEGVRASLAEEGVWSRRLPPGDVRVIVNGVDVDKIDRRVAGAGDKRAELGLRAGDFVIGTAGRLVEQKAQKDLIAALPIVLRDVPAARVVIAGVGPLEQELRAQAAALGLADRVRLVGVRSDVVEVMSVFDVFAFPSIYEGLGVVLLEAAVAGAPIVATRVRGVTDVVDDATALLVPPRDPVALAAAIVRVARDREGAKARVVAMRARVEARFSIASAARAYGALYDELLARPRDSTPLMRRVLAGPPSRGRSSG
jgi:glycosyltransferase involved in cell wall biosynthesis